MVEDNDIFPSLRRSLLFLAISLSLGSCQSPEIQAQDLPLGRKKTVGWIEDARLLGMEQTTPVKLDTGANTSSINAEILEQPEDTSESGGMIKFRFLDSEGNSSIHELPITRWVKIKDGEGGFFRRPVVKMEICVAGQWIEEEVNLADREQFDYSVLIGRNMLEKGNLLVNSGEKNLVQPNCPAREEEQS